MTTPTKSPATRSGRAWRQWVLWTFAAVALLLLVLEHRAHVLGWWLHALLGLCIVLLYLLVQADDVGARRNGPH